MTTAYYSVAGKDHARIEKLLRKIQNAETSAFYGIMRPSMEAVVS
jgi:hypothetical protein